jgi:hypothetical protein
MAASAGDGSNVSEQASERCRELGQFECACQRAGVPVLAAGVTSDEAVKLVVQRPWPMKRHPLQSPKRAQLTFSTDDPRPTTRRARTQRPGAVRFPQTGSQAPDYLSTASLRLVAPLGIDGDSRGFPRGTENRACLADEHNHRVTPHGPKPTPPCHLRGERTATGRYRTVR